MDVTPYLEPRIAPRAVFDSLEARKEKARFMIADPGGATDGWKAVTWGEHAEQIRRCALFVATEMDSGDRAAIFAPNRVEWMSAAMAIQAMGGVMVPIYGSSTAEQAGYVIEHSDSRVLFVDTEAMLGRLLEAWQQLAGVRRIVLLDDGLDPAQVAAGLRARGAHAPADAELERKVVTWSRVMQLGAARDREDPGALDRMLDAVSLDQYGTMLYTSGTSGRPKGVPLTHRNVTVNGADWLQSNASLVDEGMVDLCWLPFSHIFGFGEACLGNMLGWTTYMTDPYHVMQQLPEVRPDVFMSVPSLWEKLAVAAMREQDPDARMRLLAGVTGGRLKFCLSGGAGLKREVKELFHRAGVLIVEGYGLTECSPTLTLNRPDAFRFDSVGKPFPSVQVKLAEDGEILAKGDSVFHGYHKDPEATKAAFTEDGWFKTGDIGRWTEDGFLQIVDRKKDILVTAGGKNVAPANIEILFKDDPFIEHLVVYGDGRKYLVAGVWLDRAAADAHLDERGTSADARPQAVVALVQQRIDQVNAQLAKHETLKKFTLIDEPLTVENGLLTPTMKVKRKKVYERFGDRLEALY